MPYRDHHLWRTVWVAAAVIGTALLVVAAYLVTTHRGDGRHERSSIARDTPAQPAKAHVRRHHHRKPELPGDGATTGTVDGGSLGLPLGGTPQISITFVPSVAHHAVLRVTTSGGPAGIRYAFRTDQGVRSANARTTSRSWTSAATVRGIEPLTGLIAQVASGTVSCSVTIDGRVVDRASNSGSFATVSCFG